MLDGAVRRSLVCADQFRGGSNAAGLQYLGRRQRLRCISDNTLNVGGALTIANATGRCNQHTLARPHDFGSINPWGRHLGPTLP